METLPPAESGPHLEILHAIRAGLSFVPERGVPVVAPDRHAVPYGWVTPQLFDAATPKSAGE